MRVILINPIITLIPSNKSRRHNINPSIIFALTLIGMYIIRFSIRIEPNHLSIRRQPISLIILMDVYLWNIIWLRRLVTITILIIQKKRQILWKKQLCNAIELTMLHVTLYLSPYKKKLWKYMRLRRTKKMMITINFNWGLERYAITL